MMVRLNAVAGVQKSTAKMLTSAINYLSWQTAQEVREMKKQEEKKHLLLEKDLAAYGTSGKSRTRRRRITPEEQKSCRARLESWLVAEGYRFEAETEK